jgi:protein-disulfide isomerase
LFFHFLKELVMRFTWCKILLAALFAVAIGAQPSQAQPTNNLTPDQVREIVRDVINKEPELILESVKKFQSQKQENEGKQQADLIKTRKKELLNDPDSPVSGNPKGDVTIVDFYDYNCGYCKVMAPIVKKAVEADGKVRWVLKDYPILRPSSTTAAKASIAAAKQGKHLALHMALMELKQPLEEPLLFETAAKAGLDVEKLKKDMESPAVIAASERTSKLGQDLLIRGTPFMIIGDKVFPGALQEEALKAAIADARKPDKKSPEKN